MAFYLPESLGWGNVALCLSDLVFRNPNPRVFKELNDVDRGVEFSGFEITDDPNEERFEPRIVINPTYYHRVHSNLKDIIKPTKNSKNSSNSTTMVSPTGCTSGVVLARRIRSVLDVMERMKMVTSNQPILPRIAHWKSLSKS